MVKLQLRIIECLALASLGSTRVITSAQYITAACKTQSHNTVLSFLMTRRSEQEYSLLIDKGPKWVGFVVNTDV